MTIGGKQNIISCLNWVAGWGLGGGGALNGELAISQKHCI